MKILNFSTNWNNKLDCKYYTTIRIFNPVKHKIGNNFEVFLNKKLKHKSEIIGIKKGYLKNLDEYQCYLDTGYNKQETTKLFLKMYPKIDFKNQLIVIVLLKRIEPPKPVQEKLFN